MTGVRNEQLHLNIVNAGEGSFPTVCTCTRTKISKALTLVQEPFGAACHQSIAALTCALSSALPYAVPCRLLRKTLRASVVLCRCGRHGTEAAQDTCMASHEVAVTMQAWPNYQACASYDRKHWFRVLDTDYDKDKGVLAWHHKPERVRSTGPFRPSLSHWTVSKVTLYCQSTIECAGSCQDWVIS